MLSIAGHVAAIDRQMCERAPIAVGLAVLENVDLARRQKFLSIALWPFTQLQFRIASLGRFRCVDAMNRYFTPKGARIAVSLIVAGPVISRTT